MSRLNTATTLNELTEHLENVGEYGLGTHDAYLQFRPRSSNARDNWTVVDESHLINLEANNYRIGDGPRLVLDGKYVTGYDEDGSEAGSIAVSRAKNVIRMMRLARRNKKAIELDEGADGNPVDGQSLNIAKDGSVTVGCQDFTFEEVDTFAKQQGWVINGH